MTVTVPQDSNKRKVQSNEDTPVPNVNIEPGGLKVTRNSQNEGVPPPPTINASLWRGGSV